jgi:acid phosphatase type 7
MIRKGLWCISLAALLFGCSRDEPSTPVPPGNPSIEVALPGAVFIGSGDIGVCGVSGDEATGRIVDSVLVADSAAKLESAVFTLGDNAYPSGPGGLKDDFPRCFSPSWGSKRIMRAIHPAPGNHDYDSGSGGPYFAYFGARAGPTAKGYYSYDIAGWHLISLNSEVYFEHGSAAEAKAQEDWLRKDLRDHRALCALAYFHRPLFSSGEHGGTREMRTVSDILYNGGVDLVLNGHEHHYERFLPQTPAGIADSSRGLAEIIAGTGGGDLRGVRLPLSRNSAYEIHGRFGVLKLTLGSGEYSHAFIDTDGRVWDPARGKCH